MSPLCWQLPVGAALGYSLAAVSIQRAILLGASEFLVNLCCNAVMALIFQILWFVPAPFPEFRSLGYPVVCGLLFFAGQVMTFRAIAAGDASVSTPVLGTKVLFVALFTVAVAGSPLPTVWWWASLMASTGIALISYVRRGSGGGVLPSVLWALGAAALFGLTDVLVQKGVPSAGYARFAPLMFGVTGILSLLYVPLLRSKSARATRGGPSSPGMWLLAGSLVLGVQSLALYSSIGLYGNAAFTNILYGSRCLWSVVLVWLAGIILREGGVREVSHGVMARRCAGAMMLLGAMTLVLRTGHG